MTLIKDTDSLARFCEEARKHPYVTVDTEFMRERTYYSILCLVQLAVPGEDETSAIAVDPMADGISLEPLYDLLNDTSIMKVFHAARQDVEIFHKLTGKVPSPLFDTQIAAMVCGYGDQVGYETLVRKILNTGVDKSSRFTDWARRPLTDKQLTYAISDVTHLRDIYEHMMEQLERTGRLEWVQEELTLLTDPNIYFTRPEDAWKRLKFRNPNRRSLTILQHIAGWREEEAQRRDVPRNRVLKDDGLMEIAQQKAADEQAMESLRAVPRGFSRSSAGKKLLEIVNQALTLPEDQLATVERTSRREPGRPVVADMLKVLLRLRADEAGIAQRLIASAAEIDILSADPPGETPAMQGWRKTIFGDEALKLLRGELAIKVEGSRAKVIASP